MIFEGYVKWFDMDKGYGFITYEDDKDIFVHVSALRESGLRYLKADQKVTFEIQIDPKRNRMSAIFVKIPKRKWT